MVDAPLIELRDVSKKYGGLRPLRIARFAVAPSDMVALSGLDAGAAETFIHLVSGATVPDEGSVLVAGADTRNIATDTEWLASLDRFGIVTHRAVFIEGLPVAANMALPLTLTIDPMTMETRRAVEALADVVTLPRVRLSEAISTLAPFERLLVHLARALAPQPRMILLEHPTATLQRSEERSSFGRILRDAAGLRQCGFVALSEDREFASASGATRAKLSPATGEVTRASGWIPWLR